MSYLNVGGKVSTSSSSQHHHSSQQQHHHNQHHHQQQHHNNHHHQQQQSYQIPPSSPFVPKWHYTKEELMRIPSIKDGIPPEQELKLRQQAVGFIQDLGNRLNSYVKDNRNRITNCVCVATIHLHRFFVFHSMKTFHPKDVAAACYFLAGKSEDCSRKLDAVVKNWLCLKNNLDKPPEMDSKRYEEAGDYIVLLESIVLQTIGFNLQVELPHPIILKAMSEIFKENETGTRSRSIMEIAYFFATDILFLTNWSVRYSMNTIACMCIHLTCQWAEFEIPNYSTCSWYSKIDSKLTEKLISELSAEFSKTYRKADKIHVLAAKRLAEINRRDRPTTSSSITIPPPPLPPSITLTGTTDSGNIMTTSSASTASSNPSNFGHNLSMHQQQKSTLSYQKLQQQTSNFQNQQQPMLSKQQPATNSHHQQRVDFADEPPPSKIPAIEKKQKKVGLREYRERVALAAAATADLEDGEII